MVATIYQACQEGNLVNLRQLLDENHPDIEAKDSTGNTALMYAAQGGFVELVQELLSRGANPEEAAAQEYSKSNAQIASILLSASAGVSASREAEPLESISSEAQAGSNYPQGPYTAQPQFANGPYGPSYFDPTQEGQQPDDRSQSQRNGAANLPPPDVARMIPCKFFPSCRYGDKCIFAHPIQAGSGPGPVSPNIPGAPGHAPVFYQPQPPPGYGYTPYGPPQHFYTMAPPMPLQYAHAGVPMPVHLPPPPPHLAGHHIAEQPPHMVPGGEPFSPPFESQRHFGHPAQQQAQAHVEGQAGAPQPSVEESSVTQASGTSADPKGAEAEGKIQTPNPESMETDASALESGQAQQDASATVEGAVAGKTVHRRQSFNSFLHHHAIPFQPSQNLPVTGAPIMGMPQQPNVATRVDADGNVIPNAAGFARGKGPRRGGALGAAYGRGEYGKRAERPACYFFARNACKHAEDCRFPHILPDGTDARGPNAANRVNGAAEASKGVNRSAAKGPRGPASLAGSTVSAAQTIDAKKSTVTSATEGAEPAEAATSGSEQSTSETAPVSSSIPSKPVAAQSAVSGHGKGANGKPAHGHGSGPSQKTGHGPANGHQFNGARAPFSKGQGNGVHGRPNGSASSSNGASNASKKVVQRVPNKDDFPALNGSSAPAPSSIAQNMNGAPKVNFSAILSAPAPVRAPVEAKEPNSTESAESSSDLGQKSDEEPKAAVAAPESEQSKVFPSKSSKLGSQIPASAPDFATVAQAKAITA